MGNDETAAIIARLERLETKLDDLGKRFERQEGALEEREKHATEVRATLWRIISGVVVTFIVAFGAFLLTVYVFIAGGTK